MLVQVQTRFCLLCVLTFLFQQSHRCHEQQENHLHHHHHHHNHSDLQLHHPPHDPALPPGAVLEEEQQFYIQQLFRRHGQKDRLDFAGFQSLLLSLGLGEVKLVEVDHEELGHDHVAHLDVLDIQDGLHSHSASGHGHHKQDRPDQPSTEQSPTRCTSSHTTAASPPRDTDKELESEGRDVVQDEHKHESTNVKKRHKVQHLHPHDGHGHDGHEHEHDGHDGHETRQNAGRSQVETGHSQHEHDHSEHKDHVHEHDSGQNGHSEVEEGHKHRQDETLDLDHLHAEHNHSDHEEHTRDEDLRQNGGRTAEDKHQHLHGTQNKDGGSELRRDSDRSGRPDVEHDSKVISTRSDEHLKPSPASTITTEHRQKTGRKGQRGRDRGQNGGHKTKREAPGGLNTPTAPHLIGSAHPGGSTHQHEECLNLTQLLTHYGLSPDSLISPEHFTYLCPALLYQIDSRVCIRHYHQQVEQQALEPVNTAYVWLWGFVSITIISLLSLLGVVLVPILNQGCFKFLLTFLVALAVGTLSGDALLHLLPHSQGHHDHSEPEEHSSDLGTAFDGVWKGLTALGGIYLLFIIEHCLAMFKHYKDHKALKKGAEEGAIGRKLSDHKLNRRSDAEWLHLKPLTDDPENSTVCDNGHNDTQLTEVHSPDQTRTTARTRDQAMGQTEPLSPKKNGHKHGHGHGHSHGGNCHSDQDMKDAGIASIAWMVIMGDGMHNFSDGLAIGAAFSANLTGGISTSVAVFCHELPHELGDFAVLLKAGMSVKQAIVYNVLSALMAYVGMVIGTAVGQYTHNVTSWIFAVTAGMFLYVALVDMLPEMLHGDSEEHKRCHLGHFLLQNLGMLSGFTIMLLIAIFEDQIVFDFGF